MVDFLQHLVTGMATGAVYALVGLGIVLIYQVTGIINFAQGDFVMTAALTFALLVKLGWAMPLAVASGIAVAAACGLVTERLFVAPARGASIEVLILLTLGASIVIRGSFLIAVGGDPHFVREFWQGNSLNLGGIRLARQYVWVVAAAGVGVVGLWLFLTRSIVGRAMRACAMNSDAARTVAISPGRMSTIAFVAAAVIGGIGGIVVAPIQAPDYQIGLTLSLYGFTAAVIGGLDSAIGAVIGGLLVGVVQSLSQGYLPSGYFNTVVFGLLLAVLLIRPQGLLRTGNVKRV